MPDLNSADQDIATAGIAEIVRLHDFISAWYRGELSEDHFTPDFADALHPEFQNIQPSGSVLSRSELLEPIRAAKGGNPDFQISIEQPGLVAAFQDQALMTYVEFQKGARNSAPQNRRRSTVLFERTPDRLIWRYLQETGMP